MTIRDLDIEKIGHYLARAAMFQIVVWDDAKQLYRYEVNSECRLLKKNLKYCIKMLPLVVPGLNIIETEEMEYFNNTKYYYIYFAWSREAMEARYKKLFEKYGAADERLCYEKCSGKIERKQLSIPGIVSIEPQIKYYCNMSVGWTHHGIQLMDSAFTARIMYPNRGGLVACPHRNWRCEVGDDWWLVGSRGDSAEILELEIQASCLEPKYKENLLFNLRNYEKQRRETKEIRRDY